MQLNLDIVVILKTNKNQPEPKSHFHGVPDLVVEVLSPSNREHDLVKKKNLYEKFGVKEYWIVDPQTKATIGYTLDSGKYETMTTQPGSMHSPLLNGTFSF